MRKVEIFIKWTAMTRTTDARVASGRLPKTPVSHSSTGTVIPARTSIAIWVWVPDLSETAVLVGEPSTPKEDPRPFTMFATPRPVKSRFGSCVSSCWMAPETEKEQLLTSGSYSWWDRCRSAYFAVRWLPADPSHALPVLALQVDAALAAIFPVWWFGW